MPQTPPQNPPVLEATSGRHTHRAKLPRTPLITILIILLLLFGGGGFYMGPGIGYYGSGGITAEP